jgi:hypothetical protein
MIWLTILSISLLFLSLTLLYYALKKINQYEEFILQISKIVEFATQKMKQVDDSGHYESDDETSFFFEQLKQIQNMLNQIFETNNEEEQDAKKKEK